MKCNWKEAATLILAAFNKAPIKAWNWNYSILTLERSVKSSFMPNGIVYPGGKTDISDTSKEWLDLFSDFNLNYSNQLEINGKVPPIIQGKVGGMPKLISLKITAIRETFEESGILLCFSKNEKPIDPVGWISFKKFEGLDLWRTKVQEDASQFLKLCIHYNCCPDIFNVHLWSNWLTPSSLGKKRFDTAFFIATLKECPLAVPDKKEIVKLDWLTPKELMKSCKKKEFWLPPPQFYETARLFQFQDIDLLNNFAIDRAAQGCERWMPVQIKTADGLVSVLPGDEAYSFEDYCTPTEPLKADMTNEQYRLKFEVLHRMEFLNKFDTKIIISNYHPTSGHVVPISDYSY